MNEFRELEGYWYRRLGEFRVTRKEELLVKESRGWGSGGTNHNLLYWIGEQYDLICILKSNSSHSPEGALDDRRT